MMSHSGCVISATQWLRGKSQVVFPEFFCHNSELPDVIGFSAYGRTSIMIECKVSRSDFLRDKKKTFRMIPSRGMGDYRYYCCPKDLIKPEEVPEGWGLIYIGENRKARQVKPAMKQAKNLDAEHHLLFYYARRAMYAGLHNTILNYRGYDG